MSSFFTAIHNRTARGASSLVGIIEPIMVQNNALGNSILGKSVWGSIMDLPIPWWNSPMVIAREASSYSWNGNGLSIQLWTRCSFCHIMLARSESETTSRDSAWIVPDDCPSEYNSTKNSIGLQFGRAFQILSRDIYPCQWRHLGLFLHGLLTWLILKYE